MQGLKVTLFLKNIKNGSHDTIYTFKNYFATVFSVFSFKFSATISSIQTDPLYYQIGLPWTFIGRNIVFIYSLSVIEVNDFFQKLQVKRMQKIVLELCHLSQYVQHIIIYCRKQSQDCATCPKIIFDYDAQYTKINADMHFLILFSYPNKFLSCLL